MVLRRRSYRAGRRVSLEENLLGSTAVSGKNRIFTYEEALDTFPFVRDLTESAVQGVKALYSRVQSQEELERRRQELETASSSIVQSWADEVASLGCEVKGLWLVDWDCGDGYYCWKYPEDSIAHFHGYEDGFQGRVPLT